VALAGQLAFHCEQLRRVVCISSSSVYTKTRSPDASERRLVAAVKASEDALRQYCKARDIALVLLRPTLIYGCGLDSNISRIARLAQRFHFVPVAGRASGQRQPIHADDLAMLLLSILESGSRAHMECPAGGGSIITYREMVERIFTAFGQTPRILQIHPHALAAVVRALSWLPAAHGLNAEMVYRQNRDLVFDDSRLRAAFGFKPRRFEPVPEDFFIPASAVQLQPY
jgi:nucleoside-diphosphate-sugar epimerase